MDKELYMIPRIPSLPLNMCRVAQMEYVGTYITLQPAIIFGYMMLASNADARGFAVIEDSRMQWVEFTT